MLLIAWFALATMSICIGSLRTYCSKLFSFVNSYDKASIEISGTDKGLRSLDFLAKLVTKQGLILRKFALKIFFIFFGSRNLKDEIAYESKQNGYFGFTEVHVFSRRVSHFDKIFV